MSLTRMLEHPEVQQLFKAAFPFAPRRIGSRMAAPPVTANYSVIGTAFDYLARFWLERRHPGTEGGSWIAETGVRLLEEVAREYPELVRTAQESLKNAKREHAAYLRTGAPTEGLMRAALRLEALDIVCRRAEADGVMAEPCKGDVRDLRRLWKVMERSNLGDLRPPVSLNPDFGEASELVRGADTDVIAGGDLVDIKTVKAPYFQRKHFDQLVGYALLQRLAGRPDFGRVGIYYSRYGRLEWVGAESVYGERFDAFLPVFELAAKEMYGREGRGSAAGPS